MSTLISIRQVFQHLCGGCLFWHATLRILFIVVLSKATLTQAYAPDSKSDDINQCQQYHQFTFSWSMHTDCKFLPRGGTSKGAPITVDPDEHPGWRGLQEPGLSGFERDRRAILAMAGPYRVSFDFLEIAGYMPGFKPDRPYQSWGTEYVYVVEDRKDFISLQHIMVMTFKNDDGTVSEPMVMKHWRQDWQYQKPSILEYRGQKQWHKVNIPEDEVKGTWAQAVFQVDDSPRYESFGKWQHHANYSTWISAVTWRPLPRRESSVRDDYDLLLGTNRHSIVPTGWIQEEENHKTVLAAPGKLDPSQPFLSKELGVARYERIIDHDFTPGDEYWAKTGQYWAAVRSVWQELITKHEQLSIRKKAKDQFLFQEMFSEAHQFGEGGKVHSKAGGHIAKDALRDAVREKLKPFVDELADPD